MHSHCDYCAEKPGVEIVVPYTSCKNNEPRVGVPKRYILCTKCFAGNMYRLDSDRTFFMMPCFACGFTCKNVYCHQHATDSGTSLHEYRSIYDCRSRGIMLITMIHKPQIERYRGILVC